MPDSGILPVPAVAATPSRAPKQRWVSPLLRRILLVNAVPLVLLVAALLYLDQYQNGLLEAEVGTLREEARIYAGALGESAVQHQQDPDNPRLAPDIARPLLRRLTEPTPNAQAKLFAPDGTLIADSRVMEGQGGAISTEPLSPPVQRGALSGVVTTAYDWLLAALPVESAGHEVQVSPGPGIDWQPDVKEELRLDSSNQSREMPPFIRRTEDNRLLITVVEPVQHNGHTVGIIQLTREAREVDDSLLAIRMSILGLFALALGLTVVMSWYLSLTIARPILRLAGAAHEMREGSGRSGAVPPNLLRRHDEIGQLGHALSDAARALWARMDAIERFAVDVAHEIKNPLSSIRSAIETLRRIDNPIQQKRLTAIIAEDVMRLDRLISDISDASRVDAELSRVAAGKVDVTPILATLTEIYDATREPGDPHVVLDAPDSELVVRAVEDRLVQVLRNLITNARSFSPTNGCVTLRARDAGTVAEVSVEDEGPGIPEAQLEHIFDRFYSERPKNERFGQHSGLGLSISRQIVEALKGRISAENRRDESGQILGARFVVRLPKA